MSPHSTVLDLHLVWHPKDASGEPIVQEIEDHFLRQSCSGLHAGAIEVYRRSAPWQTDPNSPPRPVPLTIETGAAPYTAVIVLVGTELMRATQPDNSAWTHYLEQLIAAAKQDGVPQPVKTMAILLPGTRRPPTARLSQMLGEEQYLAEPDRHALRHGAHGWLARARCRELAQTLSCWLDPKNTSAGIQVFVSHTKQSADERTENTGALVRQVRTALNETRLGTFYDAQSLQPGQGWAQALESNAGRCALLVLRTDLYATREWCHREVATAKRRGRPVVVLDALTAGEARGSYLLDHVPRMPVRRERVGPPGCEQVVWSDDDIERGINRLVDAWLERVLWDRQKQRLEDDPTLSNHQWMAQAPELLTLMPLLEGEGHLHIIHPDPPLSEAEVEPLQQLAGALQRTLHITTPRMLAARPSPTSTPTRPLAGQRIGLSTSTGTRDVQADLTRLGMTRHHHDLTLRAIARAVLVHGGTLAYGGHLDKDGCTPILMDEVDRYAQQAHDTVADFDGEQAALWLVQSWSVHRQHTLVRLREADAALSLHGRLRCLDMQGEVIDMATNRQGLAEDAVPPTPPKEDTTSSLTAMRQHLGTRTQARVLLGGKRQDYAGNAPGLLEEAILALKNPLGRQPLYLIGGLGGITAHMVAAMDAEHSPCAELATPGVTLDAQAESAMADFLSLLGGPGARWAALDNGLDDDDNRKLATSHRPAEIAALICRGLQTRAQRRTQPPQSAD